MTFGALCSTNLFHSNPINVSFLQCLMNRLISVIKFVVEKLDFCISVTIHAPAHAQVGNLSYPIHFLDGAMAGIALYLTNGYVLGMTEIDMILQVVNPDPLNRLLILICID